MKSEILTAVLENKKIVVGSLIFTSFFNNSSKKMEYWMRHDYRVDKWKDYNSEKEYVKAIMQKVNYFTKKGLSNAVEIK